MVIPPQKAVLYCIVLSCIVLYYCDVELKFKVIKFGFRIENGFNMI